MKVAFLYPGTSAHDALPNWVAALARHCREHEVVQATSVAGCAGCDVTLALTQREVYPPARIDSDLAELRRRGLPYGVVHNQDNPAVPAPGDYPSFVWTFQAHERLRSRAPQLVRMPVLPKCVSEDAYRSEHIHGPQQGYPNCDTHVATFGACEPKKYVVQMAQRCKALGVPFTAFVAAPFVTEDTQGYLDRVNALVKERNAVCVHPWSPKIEDLSSLFSSVSHFLFVLPPGKGGSGGSPTSCRYATAFGRPVVVVDDENTYALDGFTVLRSLMELTEETLRAAGLPNYDWLPDRYVGKLASLTLQHWGKA